MRTSAATSMRKLVPTGMLAGLALALAAVALAPSAAHASTVNCTPSGTIAINDVTHTVTGNTACTGTVVIPADVTAIGGYAFYSNQTVTSVVFAPNSQVSTIGNYAFNYTTAMTAITLPESLTSIGDYSFGEGALTSVVIPASVTSLGAAAFRYSSSLANVYFAGNQPTVGSAAFNNIAGSAFTHRTHAATGFVGDPLWRDMTLVYWMPAPLPPTAVAGEGSATVTVASSAPVSAPTSFTVTAVEDATKACNVTGVSGSCTVTGLTGGTPYTFTATATDGSDVTSDSSAASDAVTPTAVTPTPTPVVPAAATTTTTTTATPVTLTTPAATPPALRTAGSSCTGSICTTTGNVPDGATRVIQVATSTAPRTTHATRATKRVVINCPITTTGTTRRFTCHARLGTGTWTITTQAMAGSKVIARSTTRVKAKPAPRPTTTPSAVTG